MKTIKKIPKKYIKTIKKNDLNLIQLYKYLIHSKITIVNRCIQVNDLEQECRLFL